MDITYKVELPEFVADFSQDSKERGAALYVQLDPDVGIPAWAKRLKVEKKDIDRYMLGVIKRCMRREVQDALGNVPVRFRILKGSTKGGRSIWNPANFPQTMRGSEHAGRDDFRKYYNQATGRIQPAGIVVAHP